MSVTMETIVYRSSNKHMQKAHYFCIVNNIQHLYGYVTTAMICVTVAQLFVQLARSTTGSRTLCVNIVFSD